MTRQNVVYLMYFGLVTKTVNGLHPSKTMHFKLKKQLKTLRNLDWGD